MRVFLRIILSLVLGILSGSAINILLIIAGQNIITAPSSFNPMNAQDWTISFFIFPFLAHSLGTLVGSFVAAKASKNYHISISLMVGLWFLAGGIYMTTIIPAPAWFEMLDIIICYIPMAYIGWKLNKRGEQGVESYG